MPRKPSRTTLNNADRLFAQRVRERGYCAAAHWQDGRDCGGVLECAHILSRRYQAIRRDHDNALSLCYQHHRWYTEHPLFWQRQIEYYFPGRWDALRDRAGLRTRQVASDTKRCTVCKEEKPVKDFWRAGGKLFSTCKVCGHTYRTPEKNREGWLRRQYGITVEQYEAMLAKHDGGCWVCGRLPGKSRLAVDHDHATGSVRGLLCWWCNKGLAHYHDRADLMRRAADYLEGKL